MRKINEIVSKYFSEDSNTQVCIAESTIKKTAKRIKLLHLYGPMIFEEACIDPTETVEKDIWPRFRLSESVDRMVMCIASCEPLPPATELIMPSPGQFLLID
jgi:hypothetical protein